jgi:phosphatidylethanolamine/phosphatidyl-N-methylethanolamine N-methyltransferase
MSVQRPEQIYSSYSHVYDLFFDTLLEPGRRRAIEALRIEPGDTILEVGVGTGLSLPYYPRSCHIIGIDISSTMLANARRKVRDLGRDDTVTLQRMSAEVLEYEDGCFDKVLLSHVISCVENPRRVIEEIHRVCRPRGRTVFLNHFKSRNRLVARGEHHLTPLTRRLGFVLDIPMSMVTESGLFRIEMIERVNLLGSSSVVSCIRNGDASRDDAVAHAPTAVR